MAELIPRRVLFGNPERVSPRISPDGTLLAWIAPHEGVLNVWAAPAGADGVDWAQARVVTDDTDRGIRMFTWAHDGRHVLYLRDTGGDENGRLHDVDLETMQRRDLTPFDEVATQIIAAEKKFPTEILVGLNRDNPQLHDVYRLDLVSGELVKEVENPGFIGWIADAQLVVRAGIKPQPDGGAVVMVRDSAEEEWRQLLAIDAEDALTTGPLAFSEDGASLLAESSVGADTARLVRVDLASGDVEVLAADLAAIRALHPGDPSLVGADNADATWLVGFTNDAGAVPYFSYNRETRSGRFLFAHQPELSRSELAPREPFSFPSRDGLTIHGYATFPPEAERIGLP